MEQSAKETLELVLKASNEGVWDWQVGSEEIYYSPRFLSFIQCDEITAPNFMSQPQYLIHAEDVGDFLKELELALMDTEERLFAIDCRFLKSDRTTCWLRIRAIVVRDSQGQAIRLAGSAIDISQRKEAEIALNEERSMLKTVLDSVPLHIYYKDTESRFVLINKQLAEWIGAGTPENALGKTDKDFYAEEGWQKFREDELRIMQTRQSMVGEIEREIWNNREDSWVQTVKVPWIDSHGQVLGVFGVGNRVTELVKAQKQLESLALDLHTKNKEFEEELHLAKEIQQALLPDASSRSHSSSPQRQNNNTSQTTSWRNHLELAETYLPAADLAGDYYEVFSISPDKVGLFICDVMGHGVRSALVVSMIRGVIEKARSSQGDAERFITTINDGLSGILGRAGLTLFATACYTVIDFRAGQLEIVSAGHNFPYVLRKDGTQHRFHRRARGRALGLFSTAQYRATQISLADISGFVLYTDGLFEANSPEGEEWGCKRMFAAIERHRHRDIHSMIKHLILDAQQWSADQAFEDDVCVLGAFLKNS